MEIKHTLHDPFKTASPIQFSKTIIRNIMTIATWGIHPHTTCQLDIRNKETRIKEFLSILHWSITFEKNTLRSFCVIH
ncbi:hypothetical protein ACSBR1_020662 [Camellia fascicularis]